MLYIKRWNSLYYLTICAEGVICWADGAGEQHPLPAPVGGIDVQLGQWDGILDDGGDVWWRWWRVTGAPSRPCHRVLPHVPKGTCEEPGCLRAVCWVRTPWLPGAPIVAQKGSVTEYVAATANMHSVSEVTQWRADHVHRELALETTFPLRARHEALYPWQFSKTHGGRDDA